VEILSDYTFKVTSRGRPSYPWDEWFDGRIRRLIHGSDFTASPQTFAGMARGREKNRGLSAGVDHDLGDGNGRPGWVVLRASRREAAAG
jgi:hypothetical protein